MEAIDRAIQTVYTRFVLRDFVAKILPGLVLLASLSSVTFGWSATHEAFQQARWIEAIGIGGIAWILAFAIQEIGHRARILDHKSDKVRIEAGVKFSRSCNEDERALRERYIVIKEACGNLFVSIVLSVSVLLASQELSELIKLFRNSLEWPVLLSWFVLAVLLLLSHRRHSKLQSDYTESVQKECEGRQESRQAAKKA